MLVGFLRTVLFLFVFYYLFKFVGRYLLPFLLKKGVENMQKKQQDKFNSYNDEQKKREGEVTIKQPRKPKSSTTEGETDSEYVDFEELK